MKTKFPLIPFMLVTFAILAFGAWEGPIQLKRGTGNPTYLLPGELAVSTNATLTNGVTLFCGVFPSNVVRLVGTDGVVTNDSRNLSFSNINVRGNITFENTVWDDLRVPLSTARTGASVPNYSALTNNVYTWHFVDAQTDTLYFETQLPHGYKAGTTLKPHLHWCPTTASTNEVVWQLEYTIASIGSNYPATASLTVTAACQNVSLQHLIKAFGDIPGTSLTRSAVMVGRISRLGTDGGDNYTGDACPLSFDIHYESNKIGTDSEDAPP